MKNAESARAFKKVVLFMIMLTQLYFFAAAKVQNFSIENQSFENFSDRIYKSDKTNSFPISSFEKAKTLFPKSLNEAPM